MNKMSSSYPHNILPTFPDSRQRNRVYYSNCRFLAELNADKIDAHIFLVLALMFQDFELEY